MIRSGSPRPAGGGPLVSVAAAAGPRLDQGPVALRGLATPQALREQAGEPLAPRRFLGFTVSDRSRAYRGLLKTLDDYHALWLQPEYATACSQDPEKVKRALLQASIKLTQLERQTADYLRSPFHSRKTEMELLLRQVRNERNGLMQAREVVSLARLPPDCEVSSLMLLQQAGYTPTELQARLVRLGPRPSPAHTYRSLAEWRAEEARQQQLEAYAKAGLGEQMALLEPAGLGLAGGKLYRDHEVPITARTVQGRLRPATHRGFAKTELGHGAFNTTVMAEFDDAGRPATAVFKPLGGLGRGMGLFTGIDAHHPRTAARNLASLDMALALGFDVIVPTELGTVSDGDERQVLGLVMERAIGQPAENTPGTIFTQAPVRAELTRLQVVDLLNGQIDRHSGNYFIGFTPEGRARVRGIDNDQCFGYRLRTFQPERPGAGLPSVWGDTSVDLPPVVDTGIAEAVLALTPERVHATLDGLLSRYEVDATLARLRELQAHMGALTRAGRVIAPEDWSRPEVSALLTADNSYIARDQVDEF